MYNTDNKIFLYLQYHIDYNLICSEHDMIMLHFGDIGHCNPHTDT